MPTALQEIPLLLNEYIRQNDQILYSPLFQSGMP